MVAALATNTELAATLQRILRLAQQAIPFDKGAIHLLDKDALVTQAVYTLPGVPVNPGTQGRRMSRDEGFCGYVARTGEPFLSPVISEETRLKPAGYTGTNLLIQSFLGLPLRWEGAVIGVLEMDSHTPGFFQPQQVELASVVADQAALSIVNAQLAAERQRWVQQQDALLHSVEAINSSLNLNQLLKRITAHAGVIAEGRAVLGLLDEHKLHFGRSQPLPLHASKRNGHSWPDDELYNPLRTHRAHLLTSLPAELQPHFDDPGPAVALPVLDARQGPLGVLVIARPAGAESFADAEVQLLNALANQAAIAISKARMLQREQDERRVSEVLRQMAETLSGTLTLDSVASVVLDFLGKLVPFDTATLGLLEADVLCFLGSRGEGAPPPDTRVPLADLQLSATVIQSRKPLRVDDTREAEQGRSGRFGANAAWVGVPLIANNEVLGLISLDKAEPHAYDDDDVQRLLIFASQVAITLANARLLHEAQRRQTELQALTNYNDLLIETSPIGIAVIERDRQVVRANSAFQRILLPRGGHMVGAPLTELFSSPEQAELIELVNDVFRLDAPIRVSDFPFAHPERGARWLDLAFNPLRDSEGVVSRLMMTVSDTTQRKQMEEELRERNLRIEQQLNQHRALYELGTQINAELDVQRVLQSLVASVRALFAVDGLNLLMLDERAGTFRTASAVGLSESYLAQEEAHHADSAGRLAVLRQLPVVVVGAGSNERMGELKHAARAEGIETALYLPLIYREQVIGLMALYHRTAHQYSIEEMEWLATFANQATTATTNAQFYGSIVESSSNLYAILQSMTDGVLAADEQDRITYINEPLFRMMGLPKDDSWIGQSAHALWQHFQGRVSPLPSLHLLTNADEGVRTDFLIQQEESTTQCEVELISNPIVDQRGGKVGRLLLLRDITHFRASERTKDELISVLSHELRTPLTSILGYSKLLVDRPDADKERRARWAELILDKSRLLTQLVNEVLDLSRLNIQHLSLRLEPTDLGAFVAQIADELRVTTTHHAIRVEADETLPLVPLDRQRIDQLLTNLVTNAIKYSPDGGSVTLRVAQEGTNVVLSVSDNGLGIAPEFHERIFEPFFRVDHSTTRDVYGTGLGLALVKGIAQSHGGDVSVASTPYQGSTFHVRLPLALQDPT